MEDSEYVARDFSYNLPLDLSEKELLEFPAYKTWQKAILASLNAQASKSHPFHSNPYKLRQIDVQDVDRFGGNRLGFIKFKADVRSDDDQTLPGLTFMRGGSVAMLLVLKVDGDSAEEHTVLTVQPRVPAGSLSFTEIPAGMIDDSGTFSGAAAKEIKEETGLTIAESELIDLTKLAAGYASGSSSGDEDQILQNAIYPSPGGSDEFIPIFLARKSVSATEIQNLQGKLTGLRESGEKITLQIVKLRDAWKHARRDAKTLSALLLYNELQREGRI